MTYSRAKMEFEHDAIVREFTAIRSAWADTPRRDDLSELIERTEAFIATHRGYLDRGEVQGPNPSHISVCVMRTGNHLSEMKSLLND